MNSQAVSDQDSEWTVVPRGKQRATKPTPQAPGADKDLTVEELTATYKHKKQIWRASTCRRALMQILDRKQPENGWQIKQAVLFASGSFCRDNWECQRRSITQLVAFVDIVKHLQATSDEGIGIFAQELVYTPLDVGFLAQIGIFACTASKPGKPADEGQSAQYHLDSDTFLFEAFMEKIPPAMGPLLCSDPRLFIGTSLPTQWGANKLSAEEFEEMRSLYDQFDANHSHYYFPTFDEDPNVFDGLQISWTNENEND